MSENTDTPIRSPISVIMGHVDSGKTLLLDKVRRTAVQNREAGGITQHIGASFFPAKTIEEMSSVIHQGKIKLKIPGILMVDTPGHNAFMNLRFRGASVADIAILVVDLTKGFQAQTIESVNTLKRRKVPFIVALNKIDRIGGWKKDVSSSFIKSIEKQPERIQKALESKLHMVQSELGLLGFDSDRYDRVHNFTQKIAVVPTSAITGEGIADLFLVLSGLTQQYLAKKLVTTQTSGKGVVLEVKEEQGLGVTLDVILHQGFVQSKDFIIVHGKNGSIIGKMRAMLRPKDLDEMRDPRDKFTKILEARAAVGIKIIGTGLKHVLPGSPFLVAKTMDKAEELAKEIKLELSQFRITTGREGVIVRADTLGSLEALVILLNEHGTPISSADVGDISRRDVLDTVVMAKSKQEYGAILAFGVKISDDAEELAETEGIEIFQDPIIYGLIDTYIVWRSEIISFAQKAEKDLVQLPTKIKLLPNHTFRKNKPAIIGIEILSGKLMQRDILIKEDNKRVGSVIQIKYNNESITKATKGMQVAVSVRGSTVGRQIHENDELYGDLRPKIALLLLDKFQSQLTEDEKQTLSEIEQIKKKAEHKFWPYM